MYEFVATSSEVIPVLASDIECIERTYGIEFPEVLRNYYLLHNGRAILRCEVETEGQVLTPWIMIPLKYGEPDFEEVMQAHIQVFSTEAKKYPFVMDTLGRLICWDGIDGSVSVLSEDSHHFTPVCQSIQEFFLLMGAYCQAIKDWDQREKYGQRSGLDMSEIRYVPLGSVVLLHGGTQKVMIVGRGLNVSDNGEQYYFDYGGVLYPNGFEGERMAYFNHENIERVFFAGYDDDDNEMMNARLNDYVNSHPGLKRRKIGEQ